MNELASRATGHWRGEETILVDESQTVQAMGMFRSREILNGAGFESSYVQSIQGQETLRCQSLFRFLGNGKVELVWVPDRGATQRFEGTLDGFVLTVSRTDPGGVVHRLSANYGELGALTQRMTVQPPGAAVAEVFSAAYGRRPAHRLYRVIVPVADIEQAKEFYSRLFDDDGMRVSPGRHYFELSDTVLACYDAGADGDGRVIGWKPHRNQYLYFSSSDLETMRERVGMYGGTITSRIESMPWGETLFYARDPFGNLLAFVAKDTLFVGR
ncbi:MAG: VOC family protein [Myxococcota bacterium]